MTRNLKNFALPHIFHSLSSFEFGSKHSIRIEENIFLSGKWSDRLHTNKKTNFQRYLCSIFVD